MIRIVCSDLVYINTPRIIERFLLLEIDPFVKNENSRQRDTIDC